MAEDKSGMKILVGFIATLLIFLTSLVSFGITTDVAFYIHAVTEDTLWTDDLKFHCDFVVNTTIEDKTSNGKCVSFNESSNIYGVDDANIKNIFESADDARTDNLGFLTLVVRGVNLIVTLLSLVIVIMLFFRKGGILDMIKGTSSKE